MAEETDKLTPMFRQYREIKKNYPDALLFYRMGDFYELFFEDAVIASRELQIALTTRNKNSPNSAPMCGVPWHASQSYIAQLVDRGYSVAVCEQMEDPATAKGIVKRAVTRVITPGTIMEEGSLDARRHNYLGAIFCGINESCAFVWADVSTGQWSGIEFRKQTDLWQWARKLAPAELLLMDGQKIPSEFNSEGIRIVRQPAINFELKRAAEKVLASQEVQDLNILGLADKPALTRACGAILCYLEQTQMSVGLMPFSPLDISKRMLLDEFTERNLEIFTRLNGKKGRGTLIHLMDQTITPMGARLLEDMLRHPFRVRKPLLQIQEAVKWLYENPSLRAKLRTALEKVLDLERIVMRLEARRATPADLAKLRQTTSNLAGLIDPLANLGISTLPPIAASLLSNMDNLEDLGKLLTDALNDEMPGTFQDGGIFRRGYNAELDRQLDYIDHGEENLARLLETERERTGLPRLRLNNNRLFGYFYEISPSALKNGIPPHFILRQTMATTQRFVTEELKELEENIARAEDERKKLEREMLENLLAHLQSQKDRILQTADMIGHLDYWQGLAEVGEREDWSMPELTESAELHIREGRHPVIEAIIGKANFVANDFHMDEEKRLCLLTGPNMSGKSTIMRQVAIICLLAQMGSMVPASYAEIGLVDRLFSRVGASDNLAQGQSTFMVEMMETARILRQATRRSLIILDEIGRGTSTWDGMAIASSVVEDLAARCQGQLRTIFATHYHELTALEQKVPGLFTMNIAVGVHDNRDILFLHRLVPGPSDKSYGIDVAKIAGVPYPVVQRARDLLKNLEMNRSQVSVAMQLPLVKSGKDILKIVQKKLETVDVDKVTPEEALEILKQLKKDVRG